MLKKRLILVGIVLFMSGPATSSFAQMKCAGHSSGEHKHKPTDATAQTSPIKSIDVKNKTCPVLGKKIDEKAKVSYEYKGKIYNFCCDACIEDFKKDPQKYIKKIEKEKLQGKSKQEEDPSSESHQHSH